MRLWRSLKGDTGDAAVRGWAFNNSVGVGGYCTSVAGLKHLVTWLILPCLLTLSASSFIRLSITPWWISLHQWDSTSNNSNFVNSQNSRSDSTMMRQRGICHRGKLWVLCGFMGKFNGFLGRMATHTSSMKTISASTGNLLWGTWREHTEWQDRGKFLCLIVDCFALKCKPFWSKCGQLRWQNSHNHGHF